MHHINARNVSEALYLAKQAIEVSGQKIMTRNGEALEFTTPVCTTYTRPRERVLFYPERDANPFFHLMEALWMLDGRNDVKWIKQFNSRMETFSDDGDTFHAAYGFRWREHFGFDQIKVAITRLQMFENDRRTVISMWDPITDCVEQNDGLDYPCNTQIFFNIRNEDLNMTVINRSNDMIWGAYGANAVHMSVLQEYIAGYIGCGVGKYYTFTNNLHAYTDTLKTIKNIQPDYDPYLTLGDNGLHYTPLPLVDDAYSFLDEVALFNRTPITWNPQDYNNSFLSNTAYFVRKAWDFYKRKNYERATETALKIEAKDWKKACVEWLGRHIK